MDKTQAINVGYDSIKFIVTVFCMSSIYVPMTMRSYNSLTPEEYLTCTKRCNVTGDYKGALQVSSRVVVELAWSKTGICHSV